MENRLYLNNKPKYELPDEVVIGEYRKGYKTPNIEPDIVLSCYGTVSVDKKYRTTTQLWIKSTNKDLLYFLSKYNFKESFSTTISRMRFNSWRLKKIILEEFYGVKHGE